MIVSNLESFAIRLILGGMLDAAGHGRISLDAQKHLDDLLDWCAMDGATPAGQVEIDAGVPTTSDSEEDWIEDTIEPLYAHERCHRCLSTVARCLCPQGPRIEDATPIALFARKPSTKANL